MAIAVLSDAEEILALQKLAFIAEAEIYNDFSIAPLVQTIEDLKRDFSQKIIIKKVVGENIIGSVRGYTKDRTCHIGRLMVHPDFQNKGIGTALMFEIETMLRPQCDRFEIFTGQKSDKNISLYKKLGYRVFETKNITPDLQFVYMDKHVNP